MAGFAEGGRRETAVGRVLGKVSAMRSAIALRDAVLWAGASLLVPAFVVLALELPSAAIERIAAPTSPEAPTEKPGSDPAPPAPPAPPPADAPDDGDTADEPSRGTTEIEDWGGPGEDGATPDPAGGDTDSDLGGE